MSPSTKKADTTSMQQAAPEVEVASDQRSLVLVSNRGPVEYHLEDGKMIARRGSGGVITALDALARQMKGTWVATALTDADREIAGKGRRVPLQRRTMGVRLVALDPDVAERHYSKISNPLLWFIQHDMADVLMQPTASAEVLDDWWQGYVPANQAMAAAAIGEIETLARQDGELPIVAVHDYQFYLVPRFVRAVITDVPMEFFLHIPWPGPATWRLLPHTMVEAICDSLLACDVIGFQTPDAARNFVETCLTVLPGATSPRPDTVAWRGQLSRVTDYPISVDVDLLRKQANNPVSLEYRKQLTEGWTGKTIVRIDRVDPSKNILRGFAAYNRLLQNRPDLRGQVRMQSFMVPSRSSIPEYKSYLDAIMATVEEINATYGDSEWQPIELHYENNYPQALAAMATADVIFVNPVADGMNLVAKEAMLLNERDAVLVLSNTAGAYGELGECAVTMPPHDVDATAAALERALAMPGEERARRARWLRRIVRRNDVHRWLRLQMEDLLQAARERHRRKGPRPDPTEPETHWVAPAVDREAAGVYE